MQNNSKNALVAIVLVSLCGCGSSQYVNPSFSFADIVEPTIAFLPAIGSKNPAVVDSLFEIACYELASECEIVMPALIRAKMNSKPEYIEVIDKLASSDNKKQNLQSFLAGAELATMQELVRGSKFAYVPTAFSLRDSGGAITGKVTFNLYDVGTGLLVFQASESFNVMPDGSLRSGGLLSKLSLGSHADPGSSEIARYCITLLASQGVESLRNSFLAKLE